MKTSLSTIVALAIFFTNASAAPEPLPVALATFETENGIFHGEPMSMIEKRAEGLANGLACTKCVGHHGLCTIGEGNCYPPDGCYFCGGCKASQARCQNPQKEGCQCYD